MNKYSKQKSNEPNTAKQTKRICTTFDIIQMMHGSKWTLKYDECRTRAQPECDIFN